jgi:hypothetical protein
MTSPGTDKDNLRSLRCSGNFGSLNRRGHRSLLSTYSTRETPEVGNWPGTDGRSLLQVQIKIIFALQGVPVTSGVSVVEGAAHY